MRKEMDLSKGSILKGLLSFTLPLLGTSLIQQMYNTVDLLYAGNLLGQRATAAVGASSLVISCIIGLFTGLSVGTSVITAQAYGAGNQKKIKELLHTCMTFSVIGGLVLMLLGIAGAGWMLQRMHTPADVFEDAVSYIRAYMCSILFLFIFNMNAGIIRAMGNSLTPMLLQLIGGLINIAMDFVFIRILGVPGIAWASVFSQGVPAALTFLYFAKNDDYKIHLNQMRLNGKLLKEVLGMGMPAGIQNLVITISNIFVQIKINGYGVVAISSFAAYFKIELINYLPIVAFGSAVMTFVGQNTGAGNYQRIKKGVREGIILGCIVIMALSSILLLMSNHLFLLFVPNEREVAACGLRIMKVTMPFYWLYVILEVLSDSLRGLGHSKEPMWILLLTLCGFRTLCLIVLTKLGGQIEFVAAVYPLAWAAAAGILILFWAGKLGKKMTGEMYGN